MHNELKDPKNFTQQLNHRLRRSYGTNPESATAEQVYLAVCGIVRDLLAEQRAAADEKMYRTGAKQVFYISMEFLIGKSLRNNLSNLGLEDAAREAVNSCGLELDKLYDIEPDAALGNGGLGRLAACYLDGLATCGYPATGYSILYEYGIFRQMIENGAQSEKPDSWMRNGGIWLDEHREQAVEVRFGGHIQEQWYGEYLHANHVGYDTVLAVPYDLYISGYDSQCVSRLRLWSAESPGIDMESFNRGDYAAAMLKNSKAELISKILYPNDNNIDGKALRLRQQYFLCCASVSDIVSHHLAEHGSLEDLPEKVAVHVNDTHPTLAIPELMRVLLDECGFGWQEAFEITRKTFAYTNHTVMSEALERWNADLMRQEVPRIFEIIVELDRTLQREAAHLGAETVSRMRILQGNEVRMANLCAFVSHNVNGVSKLHSDIVRDSLFSDFSQLNYDKFVNVTNGIAYRRWLLQADPGLTAWAENLIGSGFRKDATELEKLLAFRTDSSALAALEQVKLQNKQRFAKYARGFANMPIDPNTLFDIQAKRIHEYKRQHLNVLCIIRRYLDLVNGEGGSIVPRTHFFGGKAAPGYYMAKEMIRLICALGNFLERDERTRDTLRAVFLPDFRVSMSEVLMPAAELSEQISLAGTEASGTGNMKLMLAGAITIGTLDGANVEIRQAAGEENFFLFGMTKEQAISEKHGYSPIHYYNSNPRLRETLDFISSGALGSTFPELVDNLKHHDPYMVLRDFDDYCRAQADTDIAYRDRARWNGMSLSNIATFGVFSADRSVTDYAKNIWNLKPLEK